MTFTEKTAFQLHCSERQLQRIMNEFQSKGMIKKIGKGTYQIKTREEPEKNRRKEIDTISSFIDQEIKEDSL